VTNDHAWDDLITFLVNSEKPRDAGDGVCCAFAPQLVNRDVVRVLVQGA